MTEVLIVFMWIFIILLALIFIGDDIKKMLQKIRTAKIGDLEFKLVEDILNPHEHIFFYNIKRYLKYEDNYPTCDDKIKNKIVQNMLRIKLKYWYKNYSSFFVPNQTINSSSMNNLIEKIIKEYEKEWGKAKIPTYIIEEFNKKHKNKVEYMTTEMQTLFNYHNNNDTDDKVFIHIFLNRSLVLLEETFQDMEKTLKNIDLKEKDEKYDYIYQAYIP